MRKFAYTSIPTQKPKIVLENKRVLQVAATISKVGVYKYDDGYAFKSAPELLKAATTARYAKLTLDDHPATKVIMTQKQIFGGVIKPFFDRNRIRAILSWDKDVTPEETLKKIRNGDLRDVSIGFYYQLDRTPGIAPDVNTGLPRNYDYVMRDIVIDHVVGGVRPGSRGRCTFPSCGIGVDTMMENIPVKDDIVGKKGNEWCVFHCNPDGSRGGVIKCFPTEEQANAMHAAIMARKGGAMIPKLIEHLLTGDQDKRPPKQWMDNCKAKAEKFADNPGAFCGYVWYEEPKLRASFGGSSVSTKGGIGLSEETSPYEQCIAEKKLLGATDEEAQEACKQFKGAQESAYDECVRKAVESGATQEEAEEKCKGLKPVGGAQTDTPWQKCIAEEMSKEGATMEKAVAACKAKGLGVTKESKGAQELERKEGVTEHPAKSQEELPTPLEACIATRMESHGEDEATAKKWCEDELAGLHRPVEEIVESIETLQDKARAQDDAKRRRA